MKPKIIDVDIYHSRLELFVDHDAYKKCRPDLNHDEEPAYACCYYDDARENVVTVSLVLSERALAASEISYHGTLVHEAIHCAWRTLDMSGIKVPVENHETLAYLAEWMFEQAKAYFDKVRASRTPKPIRDTRLL